MQLQKGNYIQSSWFGDITLLVHMILEEKDKDIKTSKAEWYTLPVDSITIVDDTEIPVDTSRKAILEILMDVLSQATGGSHDFISSYEEAFALLEHMNLVECKEGKYYFLFANLEYLDSTG